MITRYGVVCELSDNMLNVLATYMDDDIREDLHFLLAPCDAESFLRAYVKRDPDFAELLLHEFYIELD